jgi:hypothetical protein
MTRTKLHAVLLSGMFLFMGHAAIAETQPIHTMMPVTSEDLNEQDINLPDDLSADRTLFIIAFQREQQQNVDTWIDGMELPTSNLAWYELPVIENPGLLVRWFINSGMRSGIPDTDMRAHVVSIYTDKAAFLSSLGIQDESTAYAVVVDQQGRVIETIKGDYTKEGAKKILKVLIPNKKE